MNVDVPGSANGRLPRIIAIVGFMGAGKTTVGKTLAERIGCRFVDLDDLIVASEGKPITSIFSESGEPYFRAAEARELDRLLAGAKERTILSLGGGAYVSESNRISLRSARAVVVHLSATIEELRRRIGNSPERPLARDPEKFQSLYRVRQQAYAHADITIDTSGRTVEEVTTALLEAVTLRLMNAAQRPDALQHGG